MIMSILNQLKADSLMRKGYMSCYGSSVSYGECEEQFFYRKDVEERWKNIDSEWHFHPRAGLQMRRQLSDYIYNFKQKKFTKLRQEIELTKAEQVIYGQKD